MDGMTGGEHMAGMPPPPSSSANGTPTTMLLHPHHMMMHMSFFWGKDAIILFPGWPGTSSCMYALALVLVFVLSALVELLNHRNLVRDGPSPVAAGLAQTIVHAVRVGLAYVVMLAVMSFNGGVLVVAVAGHAVGFFLFGSRAFRKEAAPPYGKTSDLPPMSC